MLQERLEILLSGTRQLEQFTEVSQQQVFTSQFA